MHENAIDTVRTLHEETMNPSIFIWLVYALWIIVIVYLIAAAAGVNRGTETHLGQSVVLMFAMIVAFLLPHLPLFNFVNFAPVNSVLSSIGFIVCVAGLVFFVWSRRSLGKNWSQTVSAKEEHELVTSGPYHYVRHPMYAGGLFACIGITPVDSIGTSERPRF